MSKANASATVARKLTIHPGVKQRYIWSCTAADKRKLAALRDRLGKHSSAQVLRLALSALERELIRFLGT